MSSGSKIPSRLKHDSIVEALVEVRFESEEVPEIVVGRLVDHESWREMPLNRLHTSEFPPSLREHDPNLRYRPTVERRVTNGSQAVRIGPHVLSYHLYSPYAGWEAFQLLITDMITALTERIKGLNVTRLGLRYINAMQASKHYISGPKDLDLSLNVGSDALNDDFHLGFLKLESENHKVMTKVVSPSFVTPSLFPADSAAIIDIDVYTGDDFSSKNQAEILNWIFEAHDYEKKSFFNVLKDETIEKLREE